MLTEISVLFISERGNKHSVMLGVGLAAVLMQPVWAPAVNCATWYFENNRRNNVNDTISNGHNNGVTGKLSTNVRRFETFSFAGNAMFCFGVMVALKKCVW